MPKTKYITLSLDPKLEEALRHIGDTCFTPLGITPTNPDIVRHLVTYHNFITGEQARKQHEAMLNWKEDDNE